MENIILDKNYNILEKKSLYNDELVEAVDLIYRAKSDNLITDSVASLLLRVILNKEFKNEIKASLPFSKSNPEIHSLYLNMKTKNTKHA